MNLIGSVIFLAVLLPVCAWAAIRPRDIAGLFLVSGGPLMDWWVNKTVGYERYVSSIRVFGIAAPIMVIAIMIMWSLGW
jgi:hypothetical protein